MAAFHEEWQVKLGSCLALVGEKPCTFAKKFLVFVVYAKATSRLQCKSLLNLVTEDPVVNFNKAIGIV